MQQVWSCLVLPGVHQEVVDYPQQLPKLQTSVPTYQIQQVGLKCTHEPHSYLPASKLSKIGSDSEIWGTFGARQNMSSSRNNLSIKMRIKNCVYRLSKVSPWKLSKEAYLMLLQRDYTKRKTSPPSPNHLPFRAHYLHLMPTSSTKKTLLHTQSLSMHRIPLNLRHLHKLSQTQRLCLSC